MSKIILTIRVVHYFQIYGKILNIGFKNLISHTKCKKFYFCKSPFNKSSLKVTFAIFWQNRQTPKYGFATTATQLISNNLNPLASPVRENFFSVQVTFLSLLPSCVPYLLPRLAEHRSNPKVTERLLSVQRSCVQRPVGRATSTRFLSFSSLYQECLTCGTLLERKVLL